MNLKKVTEENFPIFANFERENRLKNVEACLYLKWLCQSENVPEERVNVIECIGTGSGNEVYKDKAIINAKFFEYSKKLILPEDSEVKNYDTAIRHVNKFLNEDYKESQMTSLRTQIRRSTDRATQHANSWKNELRLLAQHENAIKILTDGDRIDLHMLIPEIERLGGFKLLHVDHRDRIVHFVTKEVVLSEVNKVAKINHLVNFGYFRIEWDFSQNSISAYPFKNNLCHENVYFPFFHDGNICWGEEVNVIEEAIAKGNWLKVFKILNDMISNYAGGTPYRALGKFARVEVPGVPVVWFLREDSLNLKSPQWFNHAMSEEEFKSANDILNGHRLHKLFGVGFAQNLLCAKTLDDIHKIKNETIMKRRDAFLERGIEPDLPPVDVYDSDEDSDENPDEIEEELSDEEREAAVEF